MNTMIKKLLPLILILFTSYFAAAQLGCTDPQALNFDNTASQNDGSCLYSSTSYTLTQIAELPNNLNETSGCQFMEGNLWVHEDSGNEDRIYQLDSLTGEVEQLLTIAGIDAFDWEDLAEDDTHVYIGDFGNNFGNRMDLKILKFPKDDLSENVATPEIIEFSFSDQTDFTPNNDNNNFDCESFFVWNDSIHLFSKNWADFKTRHYTLPKTPGTHIAQVRDSLEVQAQITSADINENGEILLLGYNVSTGENLLWLLFDYPETHFFRGNKRKISLGNAITNSQTEGITFRDTYTGYVVSENFSLLPQKMLLFNLQQFLDNSVATEEATFSNQSIKIYPNPFERNLQIKKADFKGKIEQIHLFDLNGKVIQEWTIQQMGDVQLNLLAKNIGAGMYILKIQTELGVFQKQVIKK